jgi:hypothetical protein
MDEAAQGIATAALTLNSVLLQALVRKGVLSREDDRVLTLRLARVGKHALLLKPDS